MMIENKYPTKRDEPITNHTARKAHLIPITSSSSRSPSSSWSWSSSSTSQRWQSLPFPWLLWAHPPSPGIRHLLSRHPAIMMMVIMMMMIMMIHVVYLCKAGFWKMSPADLIRFLFCVGENLSNNSQINLSLRIQFGTRDRHLQWQKRSQNGRWSQICDDNLILTINPQFHNFPRQQ